LRSLIFLFLITIYSTNLFATKIFVIDVEKLINENIYYEKFMEEIEKNQISEKNELNLIEKEIVDLQNEIEQSKLILDQNEINKLIEDYNIQLNKFNILIESYNLHYQNEIINKRKIVLKEIIVLVEKFAKDNNIDIVLDSNNYLVASNSINITEDIELKLKNLELKLDLKKFEQN
tara:strand:- start:1200 stop:1727 length:528 start_codon:yes stop_codon:yes gene_type:complete